MALRSAGPAVSQARSFAIPCSAYWFGELALLALGLFPATAGGCSPHGWRATWRGAGLSPKADLTGRQKNFELVSDKRVSFAVILTGRREPRNDARRAEFSDQPAGFSHLSRSR